MVPTVALPPAIPSTLQAAVSPVEPVMLALKLTWPPLPTAVGTEGFKTTEVVVPEVAAVWTVMVVVAFWAGAAVLVAMTVWLPAVPGAV